MHDHRSSHAGAGGGSGRSSAISRKISWNICRGIATSAIWKAMLRPWLMTFAPILISFSFRLDSDQSLIGSGVASVVNDHWTSKSAVHLAAYVLWKMNWIHPFADGNGRTARAVSYVVLSIKLDSILPGTPTIPDQIAANKSPYYKALEAADREWGDEEVDVSELEAVIEGMLARQLLNAAKQASGEAIE
jgi:hypothetical protein